MLRSHCHFGWPVKIGSFGGILRSHWQRFENKLAEIASAKWYIYKYLQVNIGPFGGFFLFRQFNKLYSTLYIIDRKTDTSRVDAFIL